MIHIQKTKSKHLLFFSLFVLIGLGGIYLIRWTAEDDVIIVTAHGAAGQVSGSLFQIEYGSNNLLIDIGIFYPDGVGTYEERQLNADKENQYLPLNARSVDAVILTHAHLDHIGRLPLLIRQGFTGRIFLTDATRKLLDIMLVSQIRYENNVRNWEYSINSVREGTTGKFVTAHWNNCQWQGRISHRNKRTYRGTISNAEKQIGIQLSPCNVCAADALKSLYERISFVPLAYDELLSISRNVDLMLVDAGHIPGSASVFLRMNNDQKSSVSLLFSGDIGNSNSILQYGPEPAPPADHIWVETTYGGVVRDFDLESEIRKFQEDIARVVSGGGLAWIPAFALDRTQNVLFVIEDGMERGIIPRETRVMVPSPMANQFTRKYLQEFTRPTNWFKSDIYERSRIFPEHEARLVDEFERPTILITTSGMMDAAFSLALIRDLLTRSTTTVFIVGYQDPDTPGGQLLSGREIEWDGLKIEVSADVGRYGFFSAHADARETVEWLSNQNRSETNIYLIHGDKSSLDAQMHYLEEHDFLNVMIPARGEKIVIPVTRQGRSYGKTE